MWTDIEKGKSRTRVLLSYRMFSEDWLVNIYNQNAHIGAVAVGEWDAEHQRASTSVVTRLGHKDDAIALQAAYEIAKATRSAVCVVAGIHLENVTQSEIKELVANASDAVKEFLADIS